MKKLFIIILFLLSYYSAFSQKTEVPVIDSIINRFSRQIDIFPQEKIYAQVDKSYYVSGENIWIRFFLVDALSHKESNTSRYIYAELINPFDSIVSRIKIRPVDNLHYGHIPIDENLPSGDYTIRAYTNLMKNLNEAYFFHKTIRIGDPFSASIRNNVKFLPESNNKIKLTTDFFDLKNNIVFSPKNITITMQGSASKTLKIKEDNTFTTSFSIPKNAKNTLFFEAKKDNQLYNQYIPIPRALDDFDVSFFPEGGYLLSGTTCQIAFKALNSSGLSEDITGEIFDNENNSITKIKSFHLGMGSFYLTPEKNKTYYAVIFNKNSISKRFELPLPQSQKYALKTEWRKNNLIISVLKSEDVTNQQKLYLLVHVRGIIQYFAPWDNKNEYISINTAPTPSGVMQTLLLDSNMNPISERLTFNKNKDEAKVLFTTDKLTYGPREAISARIAIKDENNIAQNGNFCISVTNDADIEPDTSTNILSYLLLSSELRGYIESPSYYLRKDNRDSDIALDMLMQTQGWRRYNIPDVVKAKYEVPTYPAELGQEISGMVKGLIRTKPIENSPILLFSTNGLYYDETETDKTGQFHSPLFELPDSTEYVIQALSKKGKSDIQLSINKELFPPVETLPPSPYKFKYNQSDTTQDDIFNKYITKADQKYTLENGMRMITLNEVKVTASGKQNKPIESIYGSLSQPIYNEEQLEKLAVATLDQTLYRTPGLRVQIIQDSITHFGTTMAFYRGSKSLLILDDYIMDQYDLSTIPIFDIAEIRFLKPNGVLGGRGMGGALVVNTKKGKDVNISTKQYNIKKILPLGYQNPAEFYSPKYETSEQKDNRTPDLRTTVYWKPDGKISDKGEASFIFYSEDTKDGSYSVKIEGITDEGKLFHCIEKIKIGE